MGSEMCIRDRGERSPLLVLLGPDSDVGRALRARRPDEAMARLRRWVGLLGRDGVTVEVVDHGGPAGTPASTGHAASLLALADAAGVAAVLTGAVRHLEPDDSVVADVLDAARRLDIEEWVPLGADLLAIARFSPREPAPHSDELAPHSEEGAV